MDSLRVTFINDDGYDSFVIPDIETFLDKLRSCPTVANKYKKMDAKEFRQFVEDGLTPMQHKKIKAINDL
jgi:hypothetical protein